MNGIVTYVTISRKGHARAALGLPLKSDTSRLPNARPSLRRIPRTARFVVVDGRAGDLDQLHEFDHLEGLWIDHAGERELSVIAGLKGLQGLLIWELTTGAIGALASMRELRQLVLPMARKIRDLSPIARLRHLETLHLGELHRIIDLSPLSRLTALRDLQVLGGMWAKCRIMSLTPLEPLRSLEYLFMASLRAADSLLTPIAKLQKLRYITMPNAFPLQQCAALAAALPRARGDILRPIFSKTLLSGVGACKTCHGDLIMTTGKPTKLLCPACDRVKLDRHIARWNTLVKAAA